MKGIIVIPSQGFGNRLRMICSSYILAQYLGIEHHILWELADDCNVEFQNIWSKHPFKLIKESDIKRLNYIFFGFIHTCEILQDSNKWKQCLDHDYLVLSGGHEFIFPTMNKEKFMSSKVQLYKQLIFKCESTIPSLPEKYACVHYRDITRFDKKDIEKSSNCNFSENSSIQEFLALINRIDKSTTLVVVSNNNTISKVMRDFFSDREIICIQNAKDRNDKGSAELSLHDFVIMTKAEYIIGTYYSSFSDEACFFNNITKIIPLSKHINTNQYHCTGFIILNDIAYLNYQPGIISKAYQV